MERSIGGKLINTDYAVDSMRYFIEDLCKDERLVIWPKENPKFNRKEENEMIESMNLIDLYVHKNRLNILNNYNKQIEELRNKSSIKEKYDEIINNCKNDLQELYISQFSKEEVEKAKNSLEGLSGYKKELQHKTSCCEFGYFIDLNFETEEIKTLIVTRDKKIDELEETSKIVKAHIGIAKTKEEVEEILKRYNIIDKKKWEVGA